MQKETRLQFPLFTPNAEWTAPFELKDITDAKEIAIDLETRDPHLKDCLLYTSPSPRDGLLSRMPSSA